MPYTSHGHGYGIIDEDDPRPATVARCGGPAICTKCATEAAQGRPTPATQATMFELHERLERVSVERDRWRRLAENLDRQIEQAVEAMPEDIDPENDLATMVRNLVAGRDELPELIAQAIEAYPPISDSSLGSNWLAYEAARERFARIARETWMGNRNGPTG